MIGMGAARWLWVCALGLGGADSAFGGRPGDHLGRSDQRDHSLRRILGLLGDRTNADYLASPWRANVGWTGGPGGYEPDSGSFRLEHETVPVFISPNPE